MRKNLVSIFAATATVAGLGVFGSAAQAAIEPSPREPVSVTLTPQGTYIYNYNVFLAAPNQLTSGDLFTFYDFAGFVSVANADVVAANGFSFSVAGLTPSPVGGPNGGTTINNFTDDAFKQNITFTYNGPMKQGGQSLGIFSLESTLPPGSVEDFIGSDTGMILGKRFDDLNYTGYVAPVPEPGEYAVAGVFAAGLFGLVLRARRRSNSVSGLAA